MAKETFYKYTTVTKKVNGITVHEHVKKAMTSREVKAYIMRVNGWTSEQYNKQYDILRNKVRAYETYQSAVGVSVDKQSVQAILFKEARTKVLEGPNYTPSLQMKRLRSFTSVSSGKAGQKLITSEKYLSSRRQYYKDYVSQRFGTYNASDPSKSTGFIGANKGAQRIVDAFIKDAEEKQQPVNYAKLEKALAKYANKVHAVIDEKQKAEAQEAVPVSSEVYGSEDDIDFDYSEYL